MHGHRSGRTNQLVSGGLNDGDRFHVSVTADGSTLTYVVRKNGGATPVVSWTLTDSGQVAGKIRLMTYSMRETRVDDVRLGGPQRNPSVDMKDRAVF